MIPFRNKALSFLLVPLILISLSGGVFHFHYCNAQKNIFTGFHLMPGYDVNSDCCSHDQEHSGPDECCQPPVKDQLSCDDNNTVCCIDVKTRIVTDKEYVYKNNTASFLSVETLLRRTGNNINSENYLSHYAVRVDYPPPYFLSTVILLL